MASWAKKVFQLSGHFPIIGNKFDTTGTHPFLKHTDL
jgi:hypothetical protein